jgi:hypothetical protein
VDTLEAILLWSVLDGGDVENTLLTIDCDVVLLDTWKFELDLVALLCGEDVSKWSSEIKETPSAEEISFS